MSVYGIRIPKINRLPYVKRKIGTLIQDYIALQKKKFFNSQKQSERPQGPLVVCAIVPREQNEVGTCTEILPHLIHFGKRKIASSSFELCKRCCSSISTTLVDGGAFCYSFVFMLTLSLPRGFPLTSKIVWR